MKRRDLIRHIEKEGCDFLREGSNQTIYVNRDEKKVSTIPRHREVDENLIKKFVKISGFQNLSW